MGDSDGPPTRIALLVLTAALAIVLAVLEALAGDRGPAPAASAPWTDQLRRVDDALRRNHVDVAARAWQEAYATSMASRRWEGMLAVGQAALRLGDASGARLAAGSRARQAYLVALFRARDDRSLDGLLRIGEAFAALGDEAMAMHCLRLAEGFVDAGTDATESHGVQELRERLGDQRERLNAQP